MRTPAWALLALATFACAPRTTAVFHGTVTPIRGNFDAVSGTTIVDAADQAFLAGDYDIALDLYLLALERSSDPRERIAYTGRAPKGLVRLSSVHPPAKEALVHHKSRLDRRFDRPHIFDKPVPILELSLLLDLNRYLGKPSDTLALYQRLDQAPPGLAAIYRDMMFADVLPELYRRAMFDAIVADAPSVAPILLSATPPSELLITLFSASLIREGLDREAAEFLTLFLLRRPQSEVCADLRTRLAKESVDAALFFERRPCRPR